MRKASLAAIVLTIPLGPCLVAGCQNLRQSGPGSSADTTTPAVAPLDDDAHPISQIIHGGLGAGGGFLIGASHDKLDQNTPQARDEAIKASQRAAKNPAKPEDVNQSPTADVNRDGYVTLDEVVALRQANLNDPEILARLRRTGDRFELTEYQQDYLRTRGVSDDVIHQIPTLNQHAARTASHEPNASAPNRPRSL
jgi:hypothetical protein